MLACCVLSVSFLSAQQKLDTLYLDMSYKPVSHPAFATIARIILVDNSGEGRFMEYNIKNGNKTAEGSFSSINMKTGEMVLHGDVYEFLDNGYICESPYINNKVWGTVKIYNSQKILEYECQYEEGKRSGYEKEYFPNGKLKVKKNYKEDVLHGSAETYDEYGNKILTGYFIDGLKHGTFIFYNQNGQILEVHRYVKGVEQR